MDLCIENFNQITAYPRYQWWSFDKDCRTGRACTTGNILVKTPQRSVCISVFLILIILTMPMFKYEELKQNENLKKNQWLFKGFMKKNQEGTGSLRC